MGETRARGGTGERRFESRAAQGSIFNLSHAVCRRRVGVHRECDDRGWISVRWIERQRGDEDVWDGFREKRRRRVDERRRLSREGRGRWRRGQRAVHAVAERETIAVRHQRTFRLFCATG